MMRRGIILLIAAIMVSIQTPLGQFFRLPLLVEHFLKHQNQGEVSFIDFLQDHYSANHNDDDALDDEQLPFKNIAFYAIGFVTSPNTGITKVQAQFTVEKSVIFQDAFIKQQFFFSVFRPPRA